MTRRFEITFDLQDHGRPDTAEQAAKYVRTWAADDLCVALSELPPKSRELLQHSHYFAASFW